MMSMFFRFVAAAAVALSAAAPGGSMSLPTRPKSPVLRPDRTFAKPASGGRWVAPTHPKSIESIRAAIRRIRSMPIRTVGEPPADDALKGVHVKGRRPADREDALRTLMIYRYLADVPYEDLVLDRELNAYTDAGSELMAAAQNFSHHPRNPGWPTQAYNFGHKATSSSNLCMSDRSSLVHAIHEYFDDSDSTNIWRLGHRRWCLNPKMSRTGMGGVGHYTAMWAYDRGRQNVPDYNYVAFPPRGYMPLKYFGKHYAWNVSLNPAKYRRPDPKRVKVRVHKADRSGRRTGGPMRLNYTKVNNEWCGIRYCVIFRPRFWLLTAGNRYVVTIDGLEKTDGTPARVEYVVEFFNL